MNSLTYVKFKADTTNRSMMERSGSQVPFQQGMRESVLGVGKVLPVDLGAGCLVCSPGTDATVDCPPHLCADPSECVRLQPTSRPEIYIPGPVLEARWEATGEAVGLMVCRGQGEFAGECG